MNDNMQIRKCDENKSDFNIYEFSCVYRAIHDTEAPAGMKVLCPSISWTRTTGYEPQIKFIDQDLDINGISCFCPCLAEYFDVLEEGFNILQPVNK